MVTTITSNILNDLTGLLTDELKPNSITYRFEKIAVSLRKENLRIEKVDCKEYYEDSDLSLILLMKNEALSNAQFEQATRFGAIEMELLGSKGDHQSTRLQTEPFFFEYDDHRIIFHYNKRKENQRLIANLIERYNLPKKKANVIKMPFF